MSLDRIIPASVDGKTEELEAFHALECIGQLDVRCQWLRCSLNRDAHTQLARQLTKYSGRKMQAVLTGKRLVDRLVLKSLRDVERDQVRDHEWNDDRIVARDLEDHDDGCERRADDAGEGRPHSDESVGPCTGGADWKEPMRYVSNRPAHHGADEHARPEDSARVARCVTDCRRNDL